MVLCQRPKSTRQNKNYCLIHRKLVIHIGTINILSKEKADTLLSMGFKYTEQKVNDTQVVYSFIDTPEIRKVVSCQFAKNEFYISKTVCL